MMPRIKTLSPPARLCGLVMIASIVFGRESMAESNDGLHFRCDRKEPLQRTNLRLEGIKWSQITPGKLTAPVELSNNSSWRFDGRQAIAYACASNTEGLAENFTWEGFFLTPSANKFVPETGIGDRLISQFAFDKGDWTRLAIGLVADRQGTPRLSVELEGFEGRTFGLGNRTVTADRWHHFALVHEGTRAAARIRWYLDYELTGELLLGGQANQNTLRPPGKAPITIGARLKSGSEVNRGFQGLIDEVRILPRPLKVAQFLRTEGTAFAKLVVEDQRSEFWILSRSSIPPSVTHINNLYASLCTLSMRHPLGFSYRRMVTTGGL